MEEVIRNCTSEFLANAAKTKLVNFFNAFLDEVPFPIPV
jgi:hypothetical protein